MTLKLINPTLNIPDDYYVTKVYPFRPYHSEPPENTFTVITQKKNSREWDCTTVQIPKFIIAVVNETQL